MDLRFGSRLRLACSLLFRGILLGTCLFGSVRLGLGEWHYSAGMATGNIQLSLDYLTAAGEAYPWDFTFRTAQAIQLYELAKVSGNVAPVAAESLRLALIADPASAGLTSMLLGAQRAMGLCDAAAITAARMVRLAPKSQEALKLAAQPCEPK